MGGCRHPVRQERQAHPDGLSHGDTHHEIKAVPCHLTTHQPDAVTFGEARSTSAPVATTRLLGGCRDRDQVGRTSGPIRGKEVAADHEERRRHGHQDEHHRGNEDRT